MPEEKFPVRKKNPANCSSNFSSKSKQLINLIFITLSWLCNTSGTEARICLLCPNLLTYIKEPTINRLWSRSDLASISILYSIPTHYALYSICTLVYVISSSLLLGKREIGRHMRNTVFNYLLTNKAVFVYLKDKNKLSKPRSNTHYRSKANKSIISPMFLCVFLAFFYKINMCLKYILQHFTSS